MVYLHRIYTKTGDDGTTGLGDGTRVSKTHPRIAAYGGVDELNSALGMLLSDCPDFPHATWIRAIQNDLFDVGADLCVPEPPPPPEGSEEAAGTDGDSSGRAPARPPLRVIPSQVDRLEKWIDEANEGLAPLHSFVLPGGTAVGARLHVARTVCRRAEIGVLHLAEFEIINPAVTCYLNRLSDLLFVLSRLANGRGELDILWKPGQGRGC